MISDLNTSLVQHVATTFSTGLIHDVISGHGYDVSGKFATILRNGTLPMRPQTVVTKSFHELVTK